MTHGVQACDGELMVPAPPLPPSPVTAAPASLFKMTRLSSESAPGPQQLGSRNLGRKVVEPVIRKPQEIYPPAHKMPQPNLRALGFPSPLSQGL